MTHNQIRKKFIEFFKAKKHTVVSSDSLVPAGDKTVLFTGAGMNQFKEQFLGNIKGFTKAASCQKCLRTDDVVNVGVTNYHHTFFEMLGNFSFGDYFKEDAIKWAWEFMVKVLKLPQDKLWVSVYKDDNEAYDIWKEKIKVQAEKIVKLGDKENFWPSEAKTKGPNGPCGPCSEIFYDYGSSVGCNKQDCTPACDCGRFVEVWNLVFTQYNRKQGGALEPLAGKNIDTGMGLERLCAVMEGVESNFETDLFVPITDAIKREVSALVDEPVFDKHKKDIYAIADHIRAVSFSICDGIMPSNEERGYVIRNLIRRSAMYGKNLGADKPFLYKLVSTIATVMKEAYPELKQRREDIAGIILSEEERFISTLSEGMRILDIEINRLKEKGDASISGEFAFKLFDTHGFPFDLAKEIAKSKQINIDEQGFEKLMNAQREQSRKKSQIADSIFKEPLINEAVEFVGYEKLKSKAKVIKIFKDDKVVDKIETKQEANVILDKTPFYGESGGQIGDTGFLVSKGASCKVIDAKKEADTVLHKIVLEKGTLSCGDTVTAQVDKERRLAIEKNHTATHILQSALQEVLGAHVRQQGSLVGPDKLRFDFTHFKGLSQDEINRVQVIVNKKIKKASAVKQTVMDIDKAKKQGALAFFGDKYDKKVRVVFAGKNSKELCGGTHVDNTKKIGTFKITSEGSVASGIRRIEAITGKVASDILKQEELALGAICKQLKCKTQEAPDKLKQLMKNFDKLEKKLKNVLLKETRNSIDELIEKADKINNIIFVSQRIDGIDTAILRNTVDSVKEKLKDQSWVVLLVSAGNERAQLIVAVSEDLVKKGTHSGKLVSRIASLAGGSGGGKPNMALGGIKNISGIDNMLLKAKEIITEELASL